MLFYRSQAFSFLSFLFLFQAAPMAYGSFQATAMWDPSHIRNLHHSSQQHLIPNPLSRARDRTHVLMDTSGIRVPCTIMGTPQQFLF